MKPRVKGVCQVPGCGKNCPYTDWTTCEEHRRIGLIPWLGPIPTTPKKVQP